MYQVSKSIIIIKIENEIIASPLSLDETILWYRNKRFYECDEPLDVSQLDITKEGLLIPMSQETFNVIKEGKSDKKLNIIDGEFMEFITYEEYCINYINSKEELKEPVIIGRR